jgi:hypothetical protein
MSHGPLEMSGADDSPTCVDGVCDLPVVEGATPDDD